MLNMRNEMLNIHIEFKLKIKRVANQKLVHFTADNFVAE